MKELHTLPEGIDGRCDRRVRRGESGRVDALEREIRIDDGDDERRREELARARAQDVIRERRLARAHEGETRQVNIPAVTIFRVARRVNRHVRARDADRPDVREGVTKIARRVTWENQVTARAHEAHAATPRAARDLPAEVAIRDNRLLRRAQAPRARKRRRRVRVLREDEVRRGERAVHRERHIALAREVRGERRRIIKRNLLRAVRQKPVLLSRAPCRVRGRLIPDARSLRRECDEWVAKARHLQRRVARVVLESVRAIFRHGQLQRLARIERLAVRERARERAEEEVVYEQGKTAPAVVGARRVAHVPAVSRVEERGKRATLR